MSRRETIERLIDAILEREGGLKYTNRASDKGGPTKAGITQRTLSAWRIRHSLEPATPDDVKALAIEEIREIYRVCFVQDPRYDLIEDEQLFEHVLDAAVLHGQHWATTTLQRLLAVKADGIIGPITLAALHAADADQVNLRFAIERLKLTVGIVIRDAKRKKQYSGQIENLSGWMNRLTGFIEAEAND